MPSSPDLTGLLQAWNSGDREALDQVAALVQQELREIARRLLSNERGAARCQPTELVQESFLRLLDWRSVQWQNRAHFFGTVAGMMRRVLVDAARARNAAKRDAGDVRVPLTDLDIAERSDMVDILAINEALDALAAVSPRASRVVELRFFGGLSVPEAAEVLGVSARTVINDWNAARAWLYRALDGSRLTGDRDESDAR